MLPAPILIIEEDDDLRLAAHRLLEDAGYRVTDVPTPEGAVRLLDATPDLHLVLLDSTLPSSNAAPLLRRLARDPAFAARVSIAYLPTTLGLPWGELRAIETVLAIRVDPKPFDPDNFLHFIASCERSLALRRATMH